MPDEMLDVVTEEDLPTGQAPRAAVHARGLWHRGAHVFLFDSGGRLLVQKRSAERAQYPSVWDCSASEHVQAGESYHAAAQRGLWEELGLEGVDLRPLVRFRMNYGPNDNEISVLFKGVVDPACVRFDPVEVERVDYFTPSELQELLQAGKMSLSQWLVELLHWFLGLPSAMEVFKE